MRSVLAAEWRHRAACSPENAEAFVVGESAKHLTRANLAALSTCDSCPVIQECLTFERANPVRWSHIAGGRIWRSPRVGEIAVELSRLEPLPVREPEPAAEPEPERLLSISQVCRRLGLTKFRTRTLLEAGTIPSTKTAKGHFRVDPDELDAVADVLRRPP